ncbi:PREDICTED: uncharacterized protein LOC105366171 isoform X2 [Ceratosolen solmsi marchali]|nr:PREDICTED: uncharacterized protein LOC105366171 isoform X2 [Ceratosolen solmsi marchali]
MATPVFAEDSNQLKLAPNLLHTIEQLDENANEYDFVMAFLITIMAEYGYRVSCLYNESTETWSKEMTCIPRNWKAQEKNIYEIYFLLYKRKDIECKLIGIPIGDWLVLNLLLKGSSSNCRTRSATVNVLKYVNLHQKELGRFWHVKELALSFKNNLLGPLHGEIMTEIGIASPTLQGLPHEIKVLISNMLDQISRKNLEIS